MKTIKTALIIASIMTIMIIACVPQKFIMGNQFDGYYNKYQVDSICRFERLPNLDNWRSFELVNDKDQSSVHQYLYITKNDSIECTYVLSDLDTIYRFKKRVTKKIVKK